MEGIVLKLITMLERHLLGPLDLYGLIADDASRTHNYHKQ